MLVAPTEAAQLETLRLLAAELPFASSEQVVVDRVLGVLSELLPGRGLAVRVLDVRTREPARAYVRNAALRDSVVAEGVTITQEALGRARLKSAVAASARVLVRERWDSPFQGMATGFAVPLAAGGELYGVLDIGYPPGPELREADQQAVFSIAQGFAFALRTIRLSADAIG